MDFLKLIAKDGDLPKKQISAIGIDLGTTNSTVAEAIYNPESGKTLIVASTG
jgi:molecular chaperone DnaK (HSP70)